MCVSLIKEKLKMYSIKMNLIKCFNLYVHGYTSNYFNWKRSNPNTGTAWLASGTPRHSSLDACNGLTCKRRFKPVTRGCNWSLGKNVAWLRVMWLAERCIHTFQATSSSCIHDCVRPRRRGLTRSSVRPYVVAYVRKFLEFLAYPPLGSHPDQTRADLRSRASWGSTVDKPYRTKCYTNGVPSRIRYLPHTIRSSHARHPPTNPPWHSHTIIRRRHHGLLTTP